jgi:hypothetical protein
MATISHGSPRGHTISTMAYPEIDIKYLYGGPVGAT